MDENNVVSTVNIAGSNNRLIEVNNNKRKATGLDAHDLGVYRYPRFYEAINL